MPKQRQKGDFYRPMPIDRILLELLPEKGLVGGVHYRGRRIRDLAVEVKEMEGIDAALITTPFVGGRLRSMSAVGMVKDFPAYGTEGTNIWARLEKGTAALNNGTFTDG